MFIAINVIYLGIYAEMGSLVALHHNIPCQKEKNIS